MSISIQKPLSNTTVTVCPVVVGVNYNTNAAEMPPKPGKGPDHAAGPVLPAGWLVRATISDSTGSWAKDQSLEGMPASGKAGVTFDNDIPNGTDYTVEADLIQPGGGVFSSATPQDPVGISCS